MQALNVVEINNEIPVPPTRVLPVRLSKDVHAMKSMAHNEIHMKHYAMKR